MHSAVRRGLSIRIARRVKFLAVINPVSRYPRRRVRRTRRGARGTVPRALRLPCRPYPAGMPGAGKTSGLGDCPERPKRPELRGRDMKSVEEWKSVLRAALRDALRPRQAYAVAVIRET